MAPKGLLILGTKAWFSYSSFTDVRKIVPKFVPKSQVFYCFDLVPIQQIFIKAEILKFCIILWRVLSNQNKFRDGFRDRFRDEFRDGFTDVVTEPSLKSNFS